METRAAPRIPVDLTIVSLIDRRHEQRISLSEGDRFRVRAVDISIGGIGIVSKYFLPTGLRIILAFPGKRLGLTKTIKTTGEIRYCKFIGHSSYRCGIKFIGIPLLYKNEIAKFVAKYEKRENPRVVLAE